MKTLLLTLALSLAASMASAQTQKFVSCENASGDVIVIQANWCPIGWIPRP